MFAYCSDVQDIFGIKFNCCTSCHDEFNEGYSSPLESYRGENTLSHCCGCPDLSDEQLDLLFIEKQKVKVDHDKE